MRQYKKTDLGRDGLAGGRRREWQERGPVWAEWEVDRNFYLIRRDLGRDLGRSGSFLLSDKCDRRPGVRFVWECGRGRRANGRPSHGGTGARGGLRERQEGLNASQEPTPVRSTRVATGLWERNGATGVWVEREKQKVVRLGFDEETRRPTREGQAKEANLLHDVRGGRVLGRAGAEVDAPSDVVVGDGQPGVGINAHALREIR